MKQTLRAPKTYDKSRLGQGRSDGNGSIVAASNRLILLVLEDMMAGQATDCDTLCVNTIRTLSIDAIQKANSGHPGLPLGAAPMAYVLWREVMKHNPKDPTWFDRDRFILSAGHGSMLLYSLLHLGGYDVSLDDIKGY